jgi:hypothetical protein
MSPKKSKSGKGPQRHAEGEHGEKTRKFIRSEQITSKPRDEQDPTGPRYDPAEIAEHDSIGKDRLFEDRQQHDEAEKGSEQTRLLRDKDRHGHEAPEKLAERNEQNRKLKW